MEKDMFKDFREICWAEKKTVSDKINELVVETLEKKALGDQNPINILYGIEKEKPLDTSLDNWIQHIAPVQDQTNLNKIKGMAMAIAKKVDIRSMELYRSGIKA